MSKEKSPAELKFAEGGCFFDEQYPNASRIPLETRMSLANSAISLYEEALSLGLTAKDEIECHARLGVLFMIAQGVEGDPDVRSLHKSLDEINEKGLERVPNYRRCIMEQETAMELDRQTGSHFFGNSPNHLALLRESNPLHVRHSLFLRQTQGVSTAISYLEERIKRFQDFGSSPLPLLTFFIGVFYDESGDTDMAIKWFNLTANAEVPAINLQEFNLKEGARIKLEELISERKAQTTQEKGRLIATAVYGKDLILGIVARVKGYFVHRRVAARRSRSVEMIEIVDAEGGRHRIPLPPHSVPGEITTRTNECFTAATIEELRDYFHRSLPDAGWELGDISRASPGILQESSGLSFVFRSGDKRLHILDFCDLGRPRKLTITIAVNVKPSQLETELAEIKILGEAGNRDAVEALSALLSDVRTKIRREAIRALTILKDERSLQPMIDKLNDYDTEVRQLAACALGQLGSKEAVEPLIVGLNRSDYEFQATCAQALGDIKDNRAVKALINALKQHPYWKVQILAALALGEIGDRSSVEPLKACLKNTKNESKVRLMAFLSLRKLLSESEIDTVFQEMWLQRIRQGMIGQSDQGSFEDHLKNAVTDNVAELTAEIISGLLGVEH